MKYKNDNIPLKNKIKPNYRRLKDNLKLLSVVPEESKEINETPLHK